MAIDLNVNSVTAAKFSGDGSSVTVTYTPDGASASVTQSLTEFLLSTTSGQAVLTAALNTVNGVASEASRTAGMAAQAVSSATASFVAQSLLEYQSPTNVKVSINGIMKLADNAFSQASNGLLGQGGLVGWNDSKINANTLFCNINPGTGRGGFAFFEYNNGYDATTWKYSDYNVAWSWQGIANFGKTATSTQLSIGRLDSGNWQFLAFNCAASSFRNGNSSNDEFGIGTYDAAIVADGGDGTAANARLRANCGSLEPFADGTIPLGSASARWGTIYSSSGTVQTSDASVKTVVGYVGDTGYAANSGLGKVFDALKPTAFTFKAAEETKQADARIHIGIIAQDVQSAFLAAGLDPAAYGVWCEDAATTETVEQVTENVETKTDDGKTIIRPVTSLKSVVEPVLDENGKQVMRQSIRYDELAMLMLGVAKERIVSLETSLSEAVSRISALESKASS